MLDSFFTRYRGVEYIVFDINYEYREPTQLLWNADSDLDALGEFSCSFRVEDENENVTDSDNIPDGLKMHIEDEILEALREYIGEMDRYCDNEEYYYDAREYD